MPKYKIKAHVSVIHEAEMEVDAQTPELAMKAAKRRFKQQPYTRRDCVVNNSGDESNPFDFYPLEATEMPHQFT